MFDKFYKEYEYKSLTYCKSPSDDRPTVEDILAIKPLKEKEILRTYEVIPYTPPPVYRTSVTMFMAEDRPPSPKTLIIPIEWTAEMASTPKKTKRSAYKCVTFTLDEAIDC